MNTTDSKAILIILDGWGIGNHSQSDAIEVGETPYIDSLMKKYPHSQLLTCGEHVGLPDGVMGNSEVGHLNIGAGRVIYQDLVRINKEVRENTIAKNQTLTDAFAYAKEHNKAVHFIGMISDAGVHSMDTHLFKLCDITKEYGLKKVFIHALTDGRDTDPKSGYGHIKNLEDHLKKSNGVIATLVGRYYTMDRDKRWERVKEGYDLMVNGKGKQTQNILQAIQESYAEDITDEFIKPVVRVDENNQPIGSIKNDDVVICFNYRTDRLREITTMLTQQDMPDYGTKTLNLYYVTMTRYDEKFKNIRVIYDKDDVSNTLGEMVSKSGYKQLRIAETEKYAHVTFFFSGGREDPFENEKRILIQSPKVATYDLQPEMSAFAVADAVTAELKTKENKFICLNFANGDMVGHTGIFDAILKAVKTVDSCVKQVVETAIENGYQALIIADHGNADYAMNEDGSPNTQHSLNPVPCILVSEKFKSIESGILADVAPTMLTILDMDVPNEMGGKVLVKS